MERNRHTATRGNIENPILESLSIRQLHRLYAYFLFHRAFELATKVVMYIVERRSR